MRVSTLTGIAMIFFASTFSFVSAQGTSAQTALTLALNVSASGTMNATQSDYWWKITTASDGSLYINTLSSSGLEIDNYIYDQNGINQIASYDYGTSGVNDQTHVSNLAAGTYYIRAYRYSGTGTYTITSRFTATKLQNDSEPNDSASVALTLLPNESKTGHLGYYTLGKTDIDDWWKITTSADGSLFINTLSDSTLEIDNYIYDQDKKNQIASYDFGGANINDQTHVSNLGAGTYYIRAYRYSGYGSYTLKSTFTATKLQNDSEPNDSASVALTLLPNESKTGHLGYYTLGKTDIDDWWKITTSADGSLFINTLSDSTLEIDNYIYDQDKKNQIASYDFGGANINDQTHVSNLGAGTYYIRAYRYSGYGSYTLKSTFSKTRFTADQEPNSPLASASTRTTGTTWVGHLGFYSSGITDREDFYSFTVPAGWDSLFVRVLTDSTLEADTNLYNDKGVVILNNGVSGINTVMVYTKPPAGQYFLNIYRYSGSGAYAVIVQNSWRADVPVPVEALEPPTNVTVSDVPNDQGHALALSWTLSTSEAANAVSFYRIFRSRTQTLTTPIPITRFAARLDSLVFWEARATILVDSVAAGTSAYIDRKVALSGVACYYWIQAVGPKGVSKPAPASAGPVTAVSDVPMEFRVEPPYPNPFNPAVTIRYALPVETHVLLVVYDALGRKVARLVDRSAAAGFHEVVWNGRSDSGGMVGSGMYFYRLEAGAFRAQGKMTLLR